MATIVKSTLKASGGDYSSIKDWITDLLANTPDFVANDIIPTLDIQMKGVLIDDTIDFSSSFNTDADHQFVITVAEGFRHDGVVGGGFTLHNNSASGYLFLARNNHLIIDGLEITGEEGQNQIVFQSQNTVINNSIIHGVGREISSTGVVIDNAIIYGLRSTYILSKSIIRNATVYAPEPSGDFDGDRVFRQCYCENVYLYHNHNKVQLNAFDTCSGDYNAALAMTGGTPGSNSVIINGLEDLVDPDNFDFRIKSTSSLATAGSGGGRIGAYYQSGDTPTVDPVVPYDQVCEAVNQSALLGKLAPIQAGNQTTKSVSEQVALGKLSEVEASNQITISVNAKATLQRLGSLSAVNQITGTVNQSQKLTRTANLTISNQITDTVSEYIYIERLATLSAYNQSCITVSSKGEFIDSTNLYAYNQALKTANQSASLGKSAKLTASNQTTKAVNQSALLTRLAKLNASNQIARSVNQQASLSRTAFISSYNQICSSINQASALGRFAPVNALNQATITVNQYAYLYSGTFPTFGDDDVVTVVVGGKFTCSVQSKAVSAIVKTKVYNSTVTTKLITASSMPTIKG